jgi:hypothetical protein
MNTTTTTETNAEMSARLDLEFAALMASATGGRGDGLSGLRTELAERGDFDGLDYEDGVL